MTILEEALNSPRCVISVMGEHAGESVQTIFERKAADIQRIGKTFWLIRSPKARPDQIREVCKSIPSYGIFVEPASKGGARPTSDSFAAKEFSIDKKEWQAELEDIKKFYEQFGKAMPKELFKEYETLKKKMA